MFIFSKVFQQLFVEVLPLLNITLQTSQAVLRKNELLLLTKIFGNFKEWGRRYQQDGSFLKLQEVQISYNHLKLLLTLRCKYKAYRSDGVAFKSK